MPLPRTRRLFLLLSLALSALLFSGCGTLDNEVHITYHTPTHTVTQLNLRGTGPMEELLLAGALRDSLSNVGWNVSSDDGGDGPAVLTASYEATDGNPFPNARPRAGSPPNPAQPLLQNLEVSTEESLFTRQLTVKFKNQPGAFPAPSMSDPQGQQILEALLAALGMGPQGRTPTSAQENPFVEMNLDRDSFDQMLDAVLHLKVSVTMPGSIKVTNATEQNGNTVAWKFGAAALRETHEYYVVSDEILWTKAGTAAAAGLMFLAAFALLGAYLIGQRRPKPQPVIVAPTAPASDVDTSQFQRPSPAAAADDLHPDDRSAGSSGSESEVGGGTRESGTRD